MGHAEEGKFPARSCAGFQASLLGGAVAQDEPVHLLLHTALVAERTNGVLGEEAYAVCLQCQGDRFVRESDMEAASRNKEQRLLTPGL